MNINSVPRADIILIKVSINDDEGSKTSGEPPFVVQCEQKNAIGKPKLRENS